MDTLYIHALRFARVRFARTAGILLLAVGFAAKAGAFWKRREIHQRQRRRTRGAPEKGEARDTEKVSGILAFVWQNEPNTGAEALDKDQPPLIASEVVDSRPGLRAPDRSRLEPTRTVEAGVCLKKAKRVPLKRNQLQRMGFQARALKRPKRGFLNEENGGGPGSTAAFRAQVVTRTAQRHGGRSKKA